jgi:glutathione S-transferase
MTRLLYDLAGADPARRFSPYCWRIRLALAHKDLAVETVPWQFLDKDVIAPSGQGKVPVLVDDGKWLAESWSIATYLEEAYPGRPSLFGGGKGRELSHYFSMLGDTLVGAFFRFVASDIEKLLEGANRAYYRESREKRLGMTLEAFTADREARLPALRESLTPLRMALKAQPYLGGDEPLYADYAVFGSFQWARCVSPFQLLAADDPIRNWRDRLLDAYDGLARKVPAFDT